jgi:hypothetical protein
MGVKGGVQIKGGCGNRESFRAAGGGLPFSAHWQNFNPFVHNIGDNLPYVFAASYLYTALKSKRE